MKELCNKLTTAQKKAMKQIGFGVTCRVGGYFDETNKRLNIKSANSLILKKMAICSSTSIGGNLFGGKIQLTKLGWEVFELIESEL